MISKEIKKKNMLPISNMTETETIEITKSPNTNSTFLFTVPEICQFGSVSYLVADLLNSCDQLPIASTALD